MANTGRWPIEDMIENLARLKTAFDDQSSKSKLLILNKLQKSEIHDVGPLESYHDNLCFLRAYPDNALILKLIESELQSFSSRIELYKTVSRDRRAKWLADTGIVNTPVSHEFSMELTRSISEWYPELVEIDWKQYDKSDTDKISAFLPLIVAWQENDTLDNDMGISTADWLKQARSKSDRTALSILLKMLKTSGFPAPLQRFLFENAEIPAKWTLTDCPASRTLKRIPCHKMFYQKTPIIGRTKDLRQNMKAKSSSLINLNLNQGKQYVRHIKEVLGVRCRELYPLIHAEPGEVDVYEPGRGVQIAVLGNIMDIRLPLESNFGAMLVRNGMPVGYGIGCMFFDRVEIAINIFPAYRTGESSFIIEQFFRLFHHHFGANVLLVRSYQVGDDNEEALESGSFWFYYKLGFRPANKKIRAMAKKEYAKIKADRSYRCPIGTLKRLSRSDIFFHIDPVQMENFNELPLKDLGYLVTKYIAAKFDGDRRLAAEMSVKKIAGILSIKGWKNWREDEITAFRRLAPLIACIPDLKNWTVKEKTDLARIIRAKGAVKEREFVLRCNKHKRFKTAIEKLAFEHN